MESAAPRIRSLYRRILRELPARSTASQPGSLLSHRTPLHLNLRSQFAGPSPPPPTAGGALHTPSSPSPTSASSVIASKVESSSILGAQKAPSSSSPSPHEGVQGLEGKELEERLEEGEQFAAYVRAQRIYLTLLERYNPGMNMSEEERVRLTARRVGMDLPDELLPGRR